MEEPLLVIQVCRDDVQEGVCDVVLVLAKGLHGRGGEVHLHVAPGDDVVGQLPIVAKGVCHMLYPDGSPPPVGGREPLALDDGKQRVVVDGEVLVRGHVLVYHHLTHDVEDAGDVCHLRFPSLAS